MSNSKYSGNLPVPAKISIYKNDLLNWIPDYFVFQVTAEGVSNTKARKDKIIFNSALSYEELYSTIKNILKFSSKDIFQVKYVGFSKKDEVKKEKIKKMISRHNFKVGKLEKII